MKFSSFSSNSRGVAILFKNSFKLKILNELQDPNGNFLMIDCEINNNRVTLAAIYGPNNDDPRFFHNIKNKLESLGNVSIITGGDWNVPQNYLLDTYKYKHQNNKNAQTAIHEMMEFLDLVDVYRQFHPNKLRYTWLGPNLKQSRIYYILVSSSLEHYIQNCDIGVAYKSDHSPVSINFKFSEQIRD